jgi:HPt (histidine-containing phosphotransfer) domain-containing protein
MTAHAMTGDRERCLAAGMDTYIAKPLHPDDLVGIVERTANAESEAAVPRPPSVPDDVVFDLARASARMGGDRRLLREMIAIFVHESKALMAAVRNAGSRRDGNALRQAAHTLKGSLGAIDAVRAFHAAGRVEDAARRDDSVAIPAEIARLESEMLALGRALERQRPTTAARKGRRHAATSTRRQHPRR